MCLCVSVCMYVYISLVLFQNATNYKYSLLTPYLTLFAPRDSSPRIKDSSIVPDETIVDDCLDHAIWSSASSPRHRVSHTRRKEIFPSTGDLEDHPSSLSPGRSKSQRTKSLTKFRLLHLWLDISRVWRYHISCYETRFPLLRALVSLYYIISIFFFFCLSFFWFIKLATLLVRSPS